MVSRVEDLVTLHPLPCFAVTGISSKTWAFLAQPTNSRHTRPYLRLTRHKQTRPELDMTRLNPDLISHRLHKIPIRRSTMVTQLGR
jgi:hypothetical protein